MHKISLITALMLLSMSVLAQLPKSNIYLFTLQSTSDTTFRVSQPRYLTAFNAQGYNNQPFFVSNSELYVSVQMPGMPQPDLWSLDVDRRTKTRITRTSSGEFSPGRAADYNSFSAIRQEFNGRDTVLRLWQFPIDRLGPGRPVFNNITGMGYYHWIDTRRVALFMTGNPSFLGIASLDATQVQPITTRPGRCFHKLPNGNLAFVQKSDAGAWYLMEINLYQPQAQPVRIIATLPNSEDFVVLSDGTYLMANNSRIYRFNRFRDTDWREVVDLRYYNIRNISRMALSADFKLAIVAD